MLVLSRKAGDEIVLKIGEQRVVVRVSAVRGLRVTLAIDAERRVEILRGELEQRKAG